MMKSTSLIVVTTLVIGVGIALLGWQRAQQQQQQLADYEQHVRQLLADIENNSLRHLEAGSQIEALNRELTGLRSQLVSLSNQLQLAREQVNPDYEAMEQRIRREVVQQVRQEQSGQLSSQYAAQGPVSKSGILQQLSQLDPMEVTELMTLQGQYGGFLQALDVDDARMEQIVDGLSGLIADQNQARMDLIAQMQVDNSNPRDFRQKMLAIDSAEARTEALSFVLTDEEMAVFNEFQANQPQAGITRTGLFRAQRGEVQDNTIFIGTPDNPGQTLNFQIITEPN